MAELHIIGTLHGANVQDISLLNNNVLGISCRWSILSSSTHPSGTSNMNHTWTTIQGYPSGQTQFDIPNDNSNWIVWSHPLDIHLTTHSIHGWPKLIIELIKQDQFYRYQLIGYGIIPLPITPGTHRLNCSIWRPYTSWFDSIKAYFLGSNISLKSLDYLISSTDRYQLTTIPVACTIFTEISIIHRGFTQLGLDL